MLFPIFGEGELVDEELEVREVEPEEEGLAPRLPGLRGEGGEEEEGVEELTDPSCVTFGGMI